MYHLYAMEMKTNYAEHEEDWTFWFEVKDS